MKWTHGQKSRLAELAEISRQYLNSILSGQKCPRELARKLESCSKDIGVYISRYDWMESDHTTNPLFHNKINDESN